MIRNVIMGRCFFFSFHSEARVRISSKAEPFRRFICLPVGIMVVFMTEWYQITVTGIVEDPSLKRFDFANGYTFILPTEPKRQVRELSHLPG